MTRHTQRRHRRPSIPLEVAQNRVGDAIEYWRTVLSSSIEQSFQTAAQLERAQARLTAALEELAAAGRAVYRKVGPFDKKRYTAVMQGPLGDRVREAEAKVRATSPPLLTVLTRAPIDRPPEGGGVAARNRRQQRADLAMRARWIEAIKRRGAEDLSRLEEGAAAASRDVLERLARAGADPLYILSVVLRYARPGAEFPEYVSLHFRPTVLSQVRERIYYPPARKKKSGPRETVRSVGMALLDRHFRKTTGRRHLPEIAMLFGIWAPRLRDKDPESEKRILVYQRIRRLKKTQQRKWGRLIRVEDIFHRAQENDFRLFSSRRALPSQ